MDKREKQPNERLRTERLRRGWSQKKVAFDLDTSKDMVSRWETGERMPSLYYQEKLCRLFGKTADELGFLDTTKAIVEPVAHLKEALTLPLSQRNEMLPLLTHAISQGILTAMSEFRRRSDHGQVTATIDGASSEPDRDNFVSPSASLYCG